jgi:hypothetical protein
MKNSLVAIAFVLSLALLGPACKPKTNVSGSAGANANNTNSGSGTGLTYKSPDGRFSVSLPPGFSEFESNKNTQPTAVGPIELTILQSENSRGALVAGYSDYPVASFKGRTPQQMFQGARDGALKNVNGTLEKEENIAVQGRPGLAIYGSGNEGVYFLFKIILDKPRLYQIGFISKDRAELDKADIQAYFDSFHLN